MATKEYIEQEFALNRANNTPVASSDPITNPPPVPDAYNPFNPALDPNLGYDAILAQGIHGPTQQNNLLSQLRSSMVMNQAPPIAPQTSVPTTTKQTVTKPEPKATTKAPVEKKPKKEDWTIGEELASVRKTANTAVAAQLQLDPATVSSLFEIKGLIMGEDGKQVMSVNVKDPSILPILKQMEFESGDKMFDPKNVVFGVETSKEKELLLRKENPDLDIQRLPTPGEVQAEAKKLQATKQEEDKETAVTNLSAATGQQPLQILQAADRGELTQDGEGNPGSVGNELVTIIKERRGLDSSDAKIKSEIAQWGASDAPNKTEKISQLAAIKSLNYKKRIELNNRQEQLNNDATILNQYSTKDHQDALQAKIDESKGSAKATLTMGREAWRDYPTLPSATRAKMMVGYENSANAMDLIVQDQPSKEIYKSKTAQLKRDMNIGENENLNQVIAKGIADIAAGKYKKENYGEVEADVFESKAAELRDIQYAGKSVSKDLLDDALAYRDGLKAELTEDQITTLSKEQKQKYYETQSFIKSNKYELLTNAWDWQNTSDQEKAEATNKVLSAYQSGVDDRREALKSILLNVKSFGDYYNDWDSSQNTVIDSLIKKINDTYE